MLIDEKLRVPELNLTRPIDLIRWFPRNPNIRILVVVDSEISIAENGGFGVGRMIKLLRETTVGCTSFKVEVAIRDQRPFSDTPNPAAGQARYRGFRFDSTAAGGQPVINGYHELFLFGFKPSNSGSQDDAEVTSPAALPASDAELAVLENFMRVRNGGVFGTGDHHFLGASMCHRIPRLGSMRRWTNQDGVPTIGGSTRLDTNQPFTPGQLAMTDVIGTGVERDSKPQPIEWVPDSVVSLGFITERRPHTVLCHPTHGPINVMPDHPHEGRVREANEIDLAATYDFGTGRHREYPNVGGQPLPPKVVAWGNTVPDPPFKHAKGAQPAVRFPMISVYDGHRAGVGRVVTDSTWHHWFNMNIDGIEAAADKTNWEKISRYFVNVATWLAPPGVFSSRCWWEFAAARLDDFGFQEFSPNATTLEIGQALRTRLTRTHGPCWVRQFVLDNICDLRPELCEFLIDRQVPDLGPLCLSCPPWDVLEAEVLGGLVKGSDRPISRFIRALESDGDGRRRNDLSTEEIKVAAQRGAKRSLDRLARNISRDFARSAKAFDL